MQREITIDLEKHQDGADVRATLLYEMIHLEINGHGSEFWSEVDRILGLGAASTLVDVSGADAEQLATLLREHTCEYHFVRRALHRRMRLMRQFYKIAGPQYDALRKTIPCYRPLLAEPTPEVSAR